MNVLRNTVERFPCLSLFTEDFKALWVSGYDFDCEEFQNSQHLLFRGMLFHFAKGETADQIEEKKQYTILQNKFKFNSNIDICVHAKLKITAN